MKTSTVKNTQSAKLINFRGIFAALAFLICLLAAQNASATSYVVTRVDDRNNATCAAGDCSLREAVKAANATTVADTITFNIPAASCNASTNVCTITLTVASGGEITIEGAGGALTINGTGANLLTIDGGAGDNRIFFSNGASAIITGVTLTGGGGRGRDVYSFGEAGAISANGGTLILNSVHITANVSSSSGGGIFFYFGTNHQILNSTLSANTAAGCAGFYNLNGILTVTNSTISGNRVTSGNGAGFCTSSFSDVGSTTLRNVTITRNSAPNGTGGILHGDGTLNLGNTIVAANTSRDGSEFITFGNGTVTTAGYNLIGNNTSVETVFPAGNPNANKDIVGTSAAPVNPLLGALQNNGVTTPTHALLTGSPAIDKGFSFGLTTDQRGLTRPFDNPSITNATGGDGSDIGAFEVQAGTTAASVSISGRVMTENGRGIRNVWITLTDSSGNVRTATTTAFGYYRFADVAAGETYIITAFGKLYTFSQPSQVLNTNGDLTDINFIGYSKFFFKQEK